MQRRSSHKQKNPKTAQKVTESRLFYYVLKQYVSWVLCNHRSLLVDKKISVRLNKQLNKSPDTPDTMGGEFPCFPSVTWLSRLLQLKNILLRRLASLNCLIAHVLCPGIDCHPIHGVPSLVPSAKGSTPDTPIRDRLEVG